MASAKVRVEPFPLSSSSPPDFASTDVLEANPTVLLRRVVHVLTWDEEAIGLPALMAQLPSDQPVYVVTPPVADDPHDYPRTVGEWVAHVQSRLSALDLGDDVVYLGWSFGGVVALEVAQAHHERSSAGGGQIDVILIDSRNPQLSNDRPKAVSKTHAAARVLSEALEKRSGTRWRYVRSRIKGTWDRKRNQGVSPDDIPPLKRAIWVSWFKYVPRRYNVSGGILWCDDSRNRLDDVALGWSRWWDGPFWTERVGHEHFAVYEQPAVTNIAAAIERATARSD
jgi:thioesterase domain-containing protein